MGKEAIPLLARFRPELLEQLLRTQLLVLEPRGRRDGDRRVSANLHDDEFLHLGIVQQFVHDERLELNSIRVSGELLFDRRHSRSLLVAVPMFSFE